MDGEAEEPLRAPHPDRRELGVFHVAHHQHGEQQHQHDQSLVLQVEVGDGGAVPLGLAERVVHRERRAGRGGREAGEPAGGRLARRQHVEAGQPEGDGGDVDVTEDPGEAAGVGEVEEVDQQRGRDAEGDHVHQRVQLGAESGAGAREPGHPAVQHVQDPGEHDEPARPPEVAVEGGDDRPEPEEQVAEGERARHDHDHLAHGAPPDAFLPLHQLHSATTVTPARVVSPVWTSGHVPTGRKRSTREPNRIMPRRSAWRTAVPTS